MFLSNQSDSVCFFNFSFLTGTPEDLLEKDELEINQEMEKESHLKSHISPFAAQSHNEETNRNSVEGSDHLSTDDTLTNADKHSSVGSVSSHRSTVASQFNQRSSRRSSCDGAVPAGAVDLASSRGRMSSCSTVMITEEQLMLNPVQPEVGMKPVHRVCGTF